MIAFYFCYIFVMNWAENEVKLQTDFNEYDDMISLKQLHYALAIEKTLHFKKAAEACNVSQSALSNAMNELEKQLGCTIFERNNKQVLITNNGMQILNKARKIKLEVNELLQISEINKFPFSTPMTIGVIPTIGPYILPKILPEVRKLYPDFKLKVIEGESHVLVDMIRGGELDAAILALPYPINGLMSFDFWEEDFYLLFHKDERNNYLDEVTSEALDLDKLMLLKDEHCLKEHTLAVCRLESKAKYTDFDSASLHTLIQMVARNLGTTIVPKMALDQLIHDKSELAVAHLNEPGPHRTISLVSRPNFVRTEELITLKSIFTRGLVDNH